LLELGLRNKSLLDSLVQLPQFCEQLGGICRTIVRHSQIVDNVIEVFVFLFHFLVVRAALIGGPTAQEVSHSLKNFIHPPHMLILEVAVVDLQKPMVLSFLLRIPMTSLPARLHYFPSPDFLFTLDSLCFLRFLLLRAKTYVHSLVVEGRLDFVLLVVLEHVAKGVDALR
jgi:hypothetical protein